MGGAWLGHAVAAGRGGERGRALPRSLLDTNSRLPYVLARDGLLPRTLARGPSRFGTPWVAVLVSAAFYARFAVFSFKELIVLNMWLYSLSLLIELGAFLWLRWTEPRSTATMASARRSDGRRPRRRLSRALRPRRDGDRGIPRTRSPGWRRR